MKVEKLKITGAFIVKQLPEVNLFFLRILICVFDCLHLCEMGFQVTMETQVWQIKSNFLKVNFVLQLNFSIPALKNYKVP